MAAIFITQQL